MQSVETTALVGWREWVSLPELGLNRIKCKVDTGARSSALHAFSIQPYSQQGEQWLRFGMHPHQYDRSIEQWCDARVHDEREVRDSGGHQSRRYFILTTVRIGKLSLPIELSLTSRDNMKFRMLLGRQALKSAGLLVDSAASYLQPWQERSS